MTSVPDSPERWRAAPAARGGDEATAKRRAFLFALVASLVLHAPLLPSRLVLFFDWLNRATTPVELAEMDGEVVVPIDFDLDPHAPAAPPAAAPPPEAPPAALPPPPVPTPPKGPDPTTVDAGAPADAGAEPPDAAPDADAPKPVASAKPDAGAPPSPALKQPADQAGGPGKIANDPNIQVLIASDKIRRHELGAAFGRLLITIPEWKSFFQGTGIDPIRDVDHLLIAGPQLRDSSKAVAILDYNLTDARMRQAIDVVVARSDPKGEWIEDAPVPTARATADEGERLFALVPGKRLLAVLPGGEEEQLGKLKMTKGFNKSSNAGIVISLSNPGRAFKGLPIEVPAELKWLRVSVVPRADGGADVALELLDASDELATRHAAELEASLEKLRKPDLGMLSSFAKIELFEAVHFSATGSIIRAKTKVDEHQLRRIMVHAEEELKKRPPKKPKTKKKAKKEKGAAAEPSKDQKDQKKNEEPADSPYE